LPPLSFTVACSAVPNAVPIVALCGVPAVAVIEAVEGVTVKPTPLLAKPTTVTTTFPVAAPLGTGTAILVALQLVGVATVPLKVTAPVPCPDSKFVPVITTGVPTIPDVGLRLVIAGVIALVNVQLRTSWVAVSVEVLPVKPRLAASPCTASGMFTSQLVVNVAFVMVSVMVIVKVVPS
jgi:hypothetical protein